jgi:hypothetical protein
VQSFGDRLHLRVSQRAGPLERLPKAIGEGGLTFHELKPVEPSLEDVFIYLLETAEDGHRPPAGD